MLKVGQWQRLLEVTGREDLKDVPQYASQGTRMDYVDEIDDIVESRIREKTVAEVMKLLQDADLPCSIVPSFTQVVNDPQIDSRNIQVDVEQMISGKVRVPGLIFKMSETPKDAAQPAPFLGQHNVEVYSELLGYDAEKINKLQRDGVI